MEGERSHSEEEIIEQEKTPEKGANVLVQVKFIRHGERTKEGELTDYGREITRSNARKSGLKEQGFDAVKAYGSQAGPKNKKGMGRAMETADIYTEEVKVEDQEYVTRAKDILNFETLKTPFPYDHTGIYNANLPENFNNLSDKEKIEAARRAQSATVNHLLSLKTPEAETFKKEVAGVFAKIINHRVKLSQKINSGSKALLVEGTHGPMPELLLEEALIRKTSEGEEIRGFQDINEIGGPLYPSESIDVLVGRNEKGELRPLKVELDPVKQIVGEMYLDQSKLDELEAFYNKIHEVK